MSGQNRSFTDCDLSCLVSLLSAFTSPIVGEAANEAHLENCGNTETVFYTATALPVPEGFCTLCALQEYSVDLPSYFLLLGSPSIQQWPFVALSECTILIENLSSNEFFVL